MQAAVLRDSEAEGSLCHLFMGWRRFCHVLSQRSIVGRCLERGRFHVGEVHGVLSQPVRNHLNIFGTFVIEEAGSSEPEIS